MRPCVPVQDPGTHGRTTYGASGTHSGRTGTQGRTRAILARGRGYPMTRHRREAGPVPLMIAILKGSADLAGAKCVADPAAHDPDRRPDETRTEQQRWAAAVENCRTCPVRGRCWAWATQSRVTGVTAASVHPGKDRPFTATTDTPIEGHNKNGETA